MEKFIQIPFLLGFLLFQNYFALFTALPVGFYSAPDALIIPKNDIIQKDRIKAGTIVPYELWSYGIIPYTIDQSFSQTHIADIVEAMSRIQSKTCLQFRPYVAGMDKYYIHFTNHDDYACGSYVGRQISLIPQPLWVNPRCIDFNGLIHEVVHAVGLWHTQQRTDRDDYVTIDWAALEEGEALGYITRPQIESAYTRVDQFEQELSVSNFDVLYDYTSIMHYPQSWGQIPRVITPKNNPPAHNGSPEEMASWWDAPRDEVGLSQGDVQMISRMYATECTKRISANKS